MTTSILLSHVGELNGHDFHVLRDFALEAPEVWRNALTRLVQAGEQVEDAVERAEAAEADLADAKQTMKVVAEKIQKRVVELRRVFEQAVVTEEVFVNFEADMKDLLSEMESP